jgi:hypothetical protein
MDEQQPIEIKYYSEKMVARRWGISVRTIQRWRWINEGPTYVRIGGRVRYDIKALEEYEKQNEHHTSDKIVSEKAVMEGDSYDN